MIDLLIIYGYSRQEEEEREERVNKAREIVKLKKSVKCGFD